MKYLYFIFSTFCSERSYILEDLKWDKLPVSDSYIYCKNKLHIKGFIGAKHKRIHKHYNDGHISI